MTNSKQDSPVAPGNSAKPPKRDAIGRARKRAGAGLMEPTAPPEPPDRPLPSERASMAGQVPDRAPAEPDFKQAERDALTQTRRDIINSVRAARRKADGARERARKATVAFEQLVALVASTKPERPDWYDHPGSLSRKEIAEASGLAPVQMQRLMERYRENHTPKRRRRKAA